MVQFNQIQFPEEIKVRAPETDRALAGRALTTWHVVMPGESFFSIAARYHVSPWRLARRNRIALTTVLVPDQRLALPTGLSVLYRSTIIHTRC